MSSTARRQIVIVGAGIVGLAVAHRLLKHSEVRVTIVDRDPEGDKASLGNAGGIAVTEVMPASSPGVFLRVFGWMLDPLGPLAVRPMHAPKLLPWLARFAKSGTHSEVDRIARALAAINLRVYDDLIPLLSETGLAGELRQYGALSLYESEAGYRRDAAEWACKRANGIEVQEISGAEARRMEPALGPQVARAVLTPQWSHVDDPKRIVDGLRAWLRAQGVAIRKSEVRDVSPSADSKVTIALDGESLNADQAVIAAGAWSGTFVQRLGDRVLLESERGYNLTIPEPGVAITRELVFAERKFVAAPLTCGLRIGVAAEFGGLSAAPNYARSAALAELARRYLPGLRTAGGKAWAGHRPATPDSLPVIGRSRRHPQIFYAFGHGHLGLTQAATTGRLIGDLMFDVPPPIDLRPYGVERFA